ncbi:hypothetical protein DV736_g1672, partial [Chaetothyriales sp. CBS 134916]
MTDLRLLASPRCWAINLILACSLFRLVSAANPPSSTWVHGGGPNNMTLAVNVPQNGTNDLFFHFNAPASISWAAFGFGDQMDGALIFVVYASDDEQSVVVSPRLGLGHVEPQHTDDVTVVLFSGSGITNHVFNVNGMCIGCRNWTGGSLNITSTSANMIWALGPAVNLASNDLNASIRQHQRHGNFDMNLVQATGIGGVPTIGTSSNSSSGSSDSDGPPGWDVSPRVAAHALLMILSFLIVFPGGFLFLRLFNRVWLHLGIQSFGALVVTLATAAGIAASKKDQIHPKIDAPHQILGLVIFILIVATWSLGLVSHLIFKRTGQPAKLMLGHRIVAPVAVGLGLINVCVGFHFAGHNRPIIGFVIVTILMIIIVSSAIMIKRRRAVRKAAVNTPAAMNFREGQQAHVGPEAPPPAYSTPAVPLESFQPPGREFYRL